MLAPQKQIQGRDNHGYLELVLTDEEYATIPNTQLFIPLHYPGPLVIPSNATPIEVLQLKDEYNEQKRLYLECKNIEKALLRHIQDALEDKYVVTLIDEYTNLITTDIPEVLIYLFHNFSKVTSEEVAQKEAEIMSMTWLPSDPIILLTRLLEQLEKLAQQAGIPYTPAQILEKALSIIRAILDYKLALTFWKNKSSADKTQTNLKTHFHKVQQHLKTIYSQTI